MIDKTKLRPVFDEFLNAEKASSDALAFAESLKVNDKIDTGLAVYALAFYSGLEAAQKLGFVMLPENTKEILSTLIDRAMENYEHVKETLDKPENTAAIMAHYDEIEEAKKVLDELKAVSE